MLVNIHTHTTRCNHARGEDREYVESAISSGLKTLGFSDHTPYLFEGEYYSNFRMRPEQFAEYVASVNALREEFRDRIEIHLGVEAEYYPAYFEETLAFLNSFGVEYLLLGQHFIGNEIGDRYSGKPSDDENALDRYCGQCVEALSTGLFTYFAHPDLLNYVGDESVYTRHMRRICRAAADRGVPMEINLLGIREGRHYPNKTFWRIAGEEGVSTVIGSDAHSPEYVADPISERAALKLADECSLFVIEEPKLVEIFPNDTADGI